MCKKQFLEYFSVESCKSCASEAKSEKCNDFDECSRMELDYFEKGFNSAKKEYEEKQKWIKVKNDYFKQGLDEDILIKFKSSLNREVIVVGHIFQGRFYMNYSNDARPLKNVMSFRYFL